ncbi:hypothetical protein PybrP1_004959, partial [[Pythium] brassicae (nom. inval.)]
DKDTVDGALLDALQRGESARYSRPHSLASYVGKFDWYQRSCSNRESLRCFRMERSSFHRLRALVESCSTFSSTRRKRRMADAGDQLLVFLMYVGTHGSDACNENLGQEVGESETRSL